MSPAGQTAHTVLMGRNTRRGWPLREKEGGRDRNVARENRQTEKQTHMQTYTNTHIKIHCYTNSVS